jgi:O-antigen/teichoic acid export membrane protein
MSHKKKILQGSASNLVRMLVSTLVALVLPPFLVRRMSPAEYSAWVLILQFSAYVNFLDFGLQTAIGKFVAQYDATGDREANHRLLSTSFTILAAAALVGAAVIAGVTALVPRLFHQMPAALVPEARLGLVAVGLSTAFMLPFNTFLATFTGLQEYSVPTLITAISRVVSAAGLIALLFMHCSLKQLAFLMAGFNIATAVLQFVAWKRYASERVPFSFLSFDRETAARLAKYGGVLTIWTLSMLFISGLDIVIVGHYDYNNTGFYAIASSATNFMLMVISSVFGPLLPAISAMQSESTVDRIGQLAIKSTRYCALLLFLIGLPMILGAYPILSIWVGHTYAMHSTLYLGTLILGNMVRQLAYPYALVVVATGKQHLATLSAIAEAVTNLTLSIVLAQKFGAIGVAIGTLVGAFVGLGMHLIVSMPKTRSTILINRWRFVLDGLLRPLSIAAPSLLLFPFWKRTAMLPANPALLLIWVLTTAAIAWKIGLAHDERRQFRTALLKLLYWRSGRVPELPHP